MVELSYEKNLVVFVKLTQNPKWGCGCKKKIQFILKLQNDKEKMRDGNVKFCCHSKEPKYDSLQVCKLKTMKI